MDTVAEIRVRYAETDAMGIVYHTNYLVWFEVARTELMRNFGLPYTRFEAEGLGLAVVEAGARFKASAKYDDVLQLRAELAVITPRKVVFNYQITKDDKIFCEGFTSHLFTTREGKATNASKHPIWRDVQKAFKC